MTCSPWSVHAGTCDHCTREVSDGEQALYAWGKLMVCNECYETLEAEAEEEARDDEPLSLAKPVKTDWLAFAGDLTGAL